MDPVIGDGKVNVKVRFVVARLVTASLVPAQTIMFADVYSPPPSVVIAAGVVAPVEGSTTAFVYNVTRSWMSWHLAPVQNDSVMNDGQQDHDTRECHDALFHFGLHSSPSTTLARRASLLTTPRSREPNATRIECAA